jgi:hypothetical protein
MKATHKGHTLNKTTACRAKIRLESLAQATGQKVTSDCASPPKPERQTLETNKVGELVSILRTIVQTSSAGKRKYF